jgi:hypothetical protein
MLLASALLKISPLPCFLLHLQLYQAAGVPHSGWGIETSHLYRRCGRGAALFLMLPDHMGSSHFWWHDCACMQMLEMLPAHSRELLKRAFAGELS